ncbi:MAG TPA: hypothetical protein VKB88_44660 [Bryobacteraceae bacterium]|nr:hypothetical protein [Bryobacteraceae bacterium]
MRTMRLALFLLAAWTAEADTVTTRDSSSWNGKVSISGGILQLSATFRTGKVTLKFGANYVRSIDFNAAVYNPGADPTALIPKPTGAPFGGTIYTQNRTTQKCGTITVGSGIVSCDGKPIPGVIRILVGST